MMVAAVGVLLVTVVVTDYLVFLWFIDQAL